VGIEAQIQTQLGATSALTDAVSTRIYRYRRPRAAALPAVTFRRIDTEIENHSEGASVTTHCRVQVDSWSDSETGDEVRTVADAVATALKSWSNTGGSPSISSCRQMSDVDLTEYEEDGTDAIQFHISQDYELWYA